MISFLLVLKIPFFLNFTHPIFLANSNLAPTSHITPRITPQTISARTYVGNLGSNRLLERSTDMLLGVIYGRNETKFRVCMNSQTCDRLILLIFQMECTNTANRFILLILGQAPCS